MACRSDSMVKQAFNLVEVVLALMVVSVAMLGAIGLVPVGIAANQRAVSQNYSADAADQILGFMASYLQNDWTHATDASILPDRRPASIAGLNTVPALEAATDWSHPLAGDYLYPITGINGCYRLVQRTMSGGNEITDFDAIARVWKTPTSGWEYSGTGWQERSDSAYAKRVQLNLELSYPASKPYAARHKVLYTIEICRLD